MRSVAFAAIMMASAAQATEIGNVRELTAEESTYLKVYQDRATSHDIVWLRENVHPASRGCESSKNEKYFSILLEMHASMFDAVKEVWKTGFRKPPDDYDAWNQRMRDKGAWFPVRLDGQILLWTTNISGGGNIVISVAKHEGALRLVVVCATEAVIRQALASRQK